MFEVPTRDDQQGVAYPMTFVLDGSGRVERKIVEANYRLRQGGRFLFEQLTGAEAAGAGDLVEGRTAALGPAGKELLAVRAWIDSPTYYAYQRLGLHLELRVAQGWHIYGPAVPAGYQPLEIAVRSEPPGAQLGPIRWPQPTPFRVAGLAEDFAVYEGVLRLAIPIDLVIPRGSGPVRIEIEIRSQACSATECLPPASVSTTIAMPEAPTL